MSTSNLGFLTYFNLTLELDALRRNMGRVNHLQVTKLSEKDVSSDMTHSVRFWDGHTYRVLAGIVTEPEEGVELCLQMGNGKVYRFRKLGS